MSILKRGVLFWLALWIALFIVRSEWTQVTGGAAALMILALPLRLAQWCVGLMLLLSLFRLLAEKIMGPKR
jgi:NADH:ubiquinone oxidoreductase subunit K